MNLTTGLLAVTFVAAIVIAFSWGGALGVRFGKEMAIESVQKHGRFIHNDHELIGTVKTHRANLSDPTWPKPSAPPPPPPPPTHKIAP